MKNEEKKEEKTERIVSDFLFCTTCDARAIVLLFLVKSFVYLQISIKIFHIILY